MPNLTVNVEQQPDKPLVENVSLIQDGARTKIFHADLTQRGAEVLGYSGDSDTGSRTLDLYALVKAPGGRRIYATVAIRGTGWPEIGTFMAAIVEGDACRIFMWREVYGDDQPLLWSRASGRGFRGGSAMNAPMDQAEFREWMEKATQDAADRLRRNVKLYRIGHGFEMIAEGDPEPDGNVVFTGYYTEGLGSLR